MGSTKFLPPTLRSWPLGRRSGRFPPEPCLPPRSPFRIPLANSHKQSFSGPAQATALRAEHLRPDTATHTRRTPRNDIDAPQVNRPPHHRTEENPL